MVNSNDFLSLSTAYSTNFNDRISGDSCSSDLLPCSRHGTTRTHVPIILRLTHRETLRPSKFLSPVPSRRPTSALTLRSCCCSVPPFLPCTPFCPPVMPRDCCYQRDPTETDNPLMRDACRAPAEFYTHFISSPDVKGK